jgi:hypothetical protein
MDRPARQDQVRSVGTARARGGKNRQRPGKGESLRREVAFENPTEDLLALRVGVHWVSHKPLDFLA